MPLPVIGIVVHLAIINVFSLYIIPPIRYPRGSGNRGSQLSWKCLRETCLPAGPKERHEDMSEDMSSCRGDMSRDM